MLRSLNSSGSDPNLATDKVYKKDWIETRSLALETTSGNRLMPISLPRVKWLERDPDCKYLPVLDVPISIEPIREPPIFIRRQRKNVKWNREEDLVLLSMMKERIPRAAIALKLNRTVKSLVGRLHRLGYENNKTDKRRG